MIIYIKFSKSRSGTSPSGTSLGSAKSWNVDRKAFVKQWFLEFLFHTHKVSLISNAMQKKITELAYQKADLEKSSCIQYFTWPKFSVHAEIEFYCHARSDLDSGFRGTRCLLASASLV